MKDEEPKSSDNTYCQKSWRFSWCSLSAIPKYLMKFVANFATLKKWSETDIIVVNAQSIYYFINRQHYLLKAVTYTI